MKYTYEVIKRLGILEGDPDGYRIEANIMSWGGDPPKLDIRKWRPDGKPTKGLCLSEEGLQKLREIIADVTL